MLRTRNLRGGLRGALAVAFATLMIGGLAQQSQAANVLFDVEGTGGVPATTINTASLQWQTGNVLVDNGTPVVVGGPFTVLYQSVLGGIVGSGLTGGSPSVNTNVASASYGNVLISDVPLPGDVYSTGNAFTIVAKFQEEVTGIVNNSDGTQTVTLGFVSGAPNVVEIQRVDAGAPNNATGGATFLGTTILMGTVLSENFTSAFTVEGQGTVASPTRYKPLINLPLVLNRETIQQPLHLWLVVVKQGSGSK